MEKDRRDAKAGEVRRPVKVAVTGARGHLGSAMLDALAEGQARGTIAEIFGWSRPAFDLDDTSSGGGLVMRDMPDVVVHAAAWTDVDGCAMNPEVAMRRNAKATGSLASICGAASIGLIVISTNEVFDGMPPVRRPYRTDDPVHPINPYGVSKLAGEEAARQAYANRYPSRLGIIRTSWVYGPPGGDFPEKIIRAAGRAIGADHPLRLVANEFATPTYAPDLARAIVSLIEERAWVGLHHITNEGRTSRADWAEETLRLAGVHVATERIESEAWQRASQPPLWGVLEPTPLPRGAKMRPWHDALLADAPRLRAIAEEIGIANGSANNSSNEGGK